MVYSRTIIIVIGHILIITLSGLAIKAFTPPLQSLMAVGIFIFQVIIFFYFLMICPLLNSSFSKLKLKELCSKPALTRPKSFEILNLFL